MRLNDLGNKEIINICDGVRLGVLADSDLLIDEKTGKIKALLVPDSRSPFSLFNDKNFMEIPWTAVKKVGSDMIIIELDNGNCDEDIYL